MFSLNGELTRTQYFRHLAFAYGVYILGAVVVVLLLGLLGAQNPGASPTQQALALFLLAVLIAGSAMFLYVILRLIIKRARNIGNAVLWGAVAILTNPIGFIAIGFIPSQTDQTPKKRP